MRKPMRSSRGWRRKWRRRKDHAGEKRTVLGGLLGKIVNYFPWMVDNLKLTVILERAERE